MTMLTTQRVFTIAEVNALIPTLSALVGAQLREQSEIEHGLGELTRYLGKTPQTLDAEAGDSREVSRLKQMLRDRIARYESGWERIQTLGGVIKDAQTGLVDFYGRIDGRLVWLCWRYGEDTLGYYHELESGYAGRKPLTPAVRRQLLN